MKLIDDIGKAVQEILKEIGFECLGCGKCCEVKFESIRLIPYSVRVVWKGEGAKLPSEGWVGAAEGTKLPEAWDGKLRIIKKDGIYACFFYNVDNHNCDVHENRPILCRGYPLYIACDGSINFDGKCRSIIKSGIQFIDITRSNGFSKLLPLVKELKDSIHIDSKYIIPKRGV